ncbi:SymE family type I addiction module toxin [Klebsiella michiganensis]|uniref:SymE family type I addiction module toxin n=1 Tax=Klebsiella michiganensis TaxID=1134687 RepID=UPI002930917C|nr:SymE family type I addiction module toxin [Klebsiella michiganensis]
MIFRQFNHFYPCELIQKISLSVQYLSLLALLASSLNQLVSLTLSGKWLRAAGFDTGKRFTVKVMDGCIVLLPQSDKEQMLKAELLQIQQSFKSVNNTLHLV